MTTRFLRNAFVLGLLSAIGPFAIDMYLPALPSIGADLGAEHARGADDADGLLRRASASARSSTARSPTWSGASRRSISGSRSSRSAAIGCALAPEHRVAHRLPFRAGPRRLRRHGDPARHRARPAHRRRGGAADVARDAGVQRLADPGAAHRQLRSSSRSAGAPCSGAVTVAALARPGAGWHSCCPRRGPRPSGSTAASAARRRGLRRLLRDRHFLGLTFIGALRHGELLRLPGELLFRLYRPLRADAAAVQPRLLGQRDRLHRRRRSSTAGSAAATASGG